MEVSILAAAAAVGAILGLVIRFSHGPFRSGLLGCFGVLAAIAFVIAFAIFFGLVTISAR